MISKKLKECIFYNITIIYRDFDKLVRISNKDFHQNKLYLEDYLCCCVWRYFFFGVNVLDIF